MAFTGKKKYCIQCGTVIQTSFQTKFCSRHCWEEYKKEHSLTVSPERQATIFLKSTSSEEDSKFDNDDFRIVPNDKNWKSLADSPQLQSDYDSVTKEGTREPKQAQKDQTLRKEYVEFLKRRLAEKEKEVKQLQQKLSETEEKLAEAQQKLKSVDTAKMVPPIFEDEEKGLSSNKFQKDSDVSDDDEFDLLGLEKDSDSAMSDVEEEEIIIRKVPWWKRLFNRST